MEPFHPLDRVLGPCDHEPEYQVRGQCVRCAMVTDLNAFRRAAGAPAYRAPTGRPAPEPFRPLDLAFTGSCVHEPEYQVRGQCIRCGMITALDEAMKGAAEGSPGQAPFSWPNSPGFPHRPGGGPR